MQALNGGAFPADSAVLAEWICGLLNADVAADAGDDVATTVSTSSTAPCRIAVRFTMDAAASHDACRREVDTACASIHPCPDPRAVVVTFSQAPAPVAIISVAPLGAPVYDVGGSAFLIAAAGSDAVLTEFSGAAAAKARARFWRKHPLNAPYGAAATDAIRQLYALRGVQGVVLEPAGVRFAAVPIAACKRYVYLALPDEAEGEASGTAAPFHVVARVGRPLVTRRLSSTCSLPALHPSAPAPPHLPLAAETAAVGQHPILRAAKKSLRWSAVSPIAASAADATVCVVTAYRFARTPGGGYVAEDVYLSGVQTAADAAGDLVDYSAWAKIIAELEGAASAGAAKTELLHKATRRGKALATAEGEDPAETAARAAAAQLLVRISDMTCVYSAAHPRALREARREAEARLHAVNAGGARVLTAGAPLMLPTAPGTQTAMAEESQQLEFKLQVSAFDHNDAFAVKTTTERVRNTLAAFANTHGGLLLLGVNDDAVLVGLDEPAAAAMTLRTTGFMPALVDGAVSSSTMRLAPAATPAASSAAAVAGAAAATGPRMAAGWWKKGPASAAATGAAAAAPSPVVAQTAAVGGRVVVAYNVMRGAAPFYALPGSVAAPTGRYQASTLPLSVHTLVGRFVAALRAGGENDATTDRRRQRD